MSTLCLCLHLAYPPYNPQQSYIQNSQPNMSGPHQSGSYQGERFLNYSTPPTQQMGMQPNPYNPYPLLPQPYQGNPYPPRQVTPVNYNPSINNLIIKIYIQWYHLLKAAATQKCQILSCKVSDTSRVSTYTPQA
ncbi:hypothetical protein HZS_6364 [Henneguya salminicola]|nr:hypothetical protein HZS_6364 [Henneguya salminicola]